MTIAVTGATGEFGGAVLDHLRRIVPGESLVATVRDPDRAAELVGAGIEVRAGDFERPESLPVAFAGVNTLVLNATFFGVPAQVREQRVAAAIDAAAASGVGRIVLTTWPDLDNCPLESVADYRASERRVRAAGPAWTILRFGLGIADVLGRDVIWGLRDGEIVAPAGDGVATPAHVPDLAEACAVVAANDGHAGILYEVTGPDAVSWRDLAALASAIGDRDIPYRPVDDADYRSFLEGLGMRESFVTGITVLYDAMRGGWNNSPTSTLAELLGRAPVPGVEAVRARVEKWRYQV